MSFRSIGAAAQHRNWNHRLGDTGAPAGEPDPFYDDVSLLFYGNVADGASNYLDQSSAALVGVATGAPVNATDGLSFLNSSMTYFQGASSYVRFTKPGGFITGLPYTIELTWESTQQSSGFGSGINFNTIIQFGLAGVLTNGRALGADINSLAFRGASIAPTTTVGQRHVLAFTSDGAARKVYLNGTRFLNNVADSAFAPNDEVYIGCINTVLNGTQFSHGAKISQVRITDGVQRYVDATYDLATAAFPDF